MSDVVTGYVRMLPGLRGTSRSILLEIASEAKHNGHCGDLRVCDIAAVTGYSVATVKRHLGELERLGLLRKESRAGALPDGLTDDRLRRNAYWIITPRTPVDNQGSPGVMVSQGPSLKMSQGKPGPDQAKRTPIPLAHSEPRKIRAGARTEGAADQPVDAAVFRSGDPTCPHDFPSSGPLAPSPRCPMCRPVLAASIPDEPYGREHRSLRRQWSPLVATGVVACRRCLLPIEGESWDLGHYADRTIESHPEHRACNRATAKHRANGEHL